MCTQTSTVSNHNGSVAGSIPVELKELGSHTSGYCGYCDHEEPSLYRGRIQANGWASNRYACGIHHKALEMWLDWVTEERSFAE